MSVNIMTIPSSVAPSFISNYSSTTPNNWSAKRAYAHFGTQDFGPLGVNG